MSFLSDLWIVLNFIVQAIGFILTFLFICGAIGTLVAAIRGILLPLWRLGIGLSKRDIVIIASSEDGDSLKRLVEQSKLFSRKRIYKVSVRSDIEDIKNASIILFKYSGSPFNLKEVIERKNDNSALVVYAKVGEITERSEWDLMDELRNVSVCNLRGRLLNDLLTLMMTTGYERK